MSKSTKRRSPKHRVISWSRLNAAIHEAGGRPEDLASALGVSVFAVRSWMKGHGVRVSNFKKFESFRKKTNGQQLDMLTEPVPLAKPQQQPDQISIAVDGVEMKLRRGMTVNINGKTITVS